jgi:gamma-glutamyltranspeptidase
MGCSNKTLFGTFGFVGTGFYLQDETNVPADVSGLVRFDGHGGFIATELNMVANGEALPGNPYEVPTGGATTAYSVNPDCSFTATISGQFGGSVTVTLWGIIINLTGTEITGNISSSNPNVTGTFHGTMVPPIASPPALI